MKNTIVLYSTKNEKDALCIESMFRGYDMQEIYTLKPNITSEYMHVYTWTKKEELEESYIYDLNRKIVDDRLENSNYNQVIIYGTDIVMIETIEYIIRKNKEREEKDKFKVKVISEIYEGTLFYDRERSSFLKCIELLKEKGIYKMYFLKKGIYEAYLNMGYNVRIFNA
ncbi:MAG: hypothetical protein HXK70_03295 [Clostridiales bacterium]|nr:hypothetical protein [Clostridiales bacterium]